MATMSEVAERAGVSAATVSHVLNGTRNVTDKTRTRVLAAVEELGYRPNRLARSLVSGATHTIGLIIPDSANPFFAELARAIESTMFEQGYNVILCNSDGDSSREILYANVLVDKQVDGLIFVAVGVGTDHLLSLQRRRVPVVVVDREVPGVDVDSVLTDNELGGWLATRHLLELGHRRIACITGPSDITPSAKRVTGFRRAMAEEGVPVDEALVVRGDFQYEGGSQAARTLLGGEDPPSAIFACNDLMAVAVMAAADEMGFALPTGLSVVGFDDIPLASFVRPSLTTVHEAKYQMGVLGAKALLERMQGSDEPSRRTVLSTRLVVRRSTAPPKQ